MIDVVEILQHWHAGRPKLVLAASLGVDPKTVRKYVAPAEAEGIRPNDGLVLDRAGWTAKVTGWFPELVDARARSSTWPMLEARRELITKMLETNTVATVHQRLRDEHDLRVSVTSLRRYVWQAFRTGGVAQRRRYARWSRPARRPRSTTATWAGGWTRSATGSAGCGRSWSCWPARGTCSCVRC